MDVPAVGGRRGREPVIVRALTRGAGPDSAAAAAAAPLKAESFGFLEKLLMCCQSKHRGQHGEAVWETSSCF